MGRIEYVLLACVIISIIALGSWLTVWAQWPTHLVAVAILLIVLGGSVIGVLLSVQKRPPD